MAAIAQKLSRLAGDAAGAGFVLAAVETARLGGGETPIWLALIATGLVLLAAVAIGVPSLAVAHYFARRKWAGGWLAALRDGGPARVRAVWRGLLLVAALGLVFAAGHALAVWSFGRFNAAGAVGLLHGAAAVVAVLASAALALWVDDLAGPALERAGFLERLVTGWVGVVGFTIAAAALIIGIDRFATWAAPAADFRALALAGLFAAALAAASLVGVSRRLGARGLGTLLGMTGLLIATALWQVGERADPRRAIAADGIPSGHALRLLWSLSDRDGDGYASRFGGGDCDDGDRWINPEANEIIGNAVDENCSGADLTIDQIAARARPVPSRNPGAERRNVVLLTIDAARADHVGAYGYKRPTTPNVDRLAARGTRFEWAITPSPTTRRAIPAMMAGRYASTLAYVEGGGIWPPRIKKGYHGMLAETFAAAGYQTAAILCCKTLFDERVGVTNGFGFVDQSAHKLKRKYHGDYLAEKVEAWLETERDPGRPFFLWVHFLDAHNPYQKLPGAPDFGKRAVDRYDGELAYVDDKIGLMLRSLQSRELESQTIFAISSDHGDEFGEHGNKYHGTSLFNELVRVPLIVTVPGQAPAVVRAPVSVIDIGPTLLDLVGLQRPAGQNGRSLAEAVGSGAAPDRMVLAELIADRNIERNLRAGFREGWKLIWDLDADTYQLFSLDRDPGDRRDRALAEPDRLATMRDELRELVDRELGLLPGDKHYAERIEAMRRERARNSALPQSE